MMLSPLVSFSQVQFGLKGGFNLSKISFSEHKSNLRSENRAGFFIGPTVDFKIPFLVFGTEISALYSQKDITATGFDATLKTLEVPLNFKYSIEFGKILGIFFAAGPQFGFNLGHAWDSGYEIEKQNTSMNIGTGMKFLGHFQVGVYYNIALSRTATLHIADTDVLPAGTAKIRENTWQASLSYLF